MVWRDSTDRDATRAASVSASTLERPAAAPTISAARWASPAPAVLRTFAAECRLVNDLSLVDHPASSNSRGYGYAHLRILGAKRFGPCADDVFNLRRLRQAQSCCRFGAVQSDQVQVPQQAAFDDFRHFLRRKRRRTKEAMLRAEPQQGGPCVERHLWSGQCNPPPGKALETRPPLRRPAVDRRANTPNRPSSGCRRCRPGTGSRRRTASARRPSAPRSGCPCPYAPSRRTFAARLRRRRPCQWAA